ncbi:TPA: hypothetical protein ACOEEX_003049 [Enterobacter hormaechei subsp. xiangfangensis]
MAAFSSSEQAPKFTD